MPGASTLDIQRRGIHDQVLAQAACLHRAARAAGRLVPGSSAARSGRRSRRDRCDHRSSRENPLRREPGRFCRAGYKLLPGWSYKSQWWISRNANGAFNARGIHGQTSYVDPAAEMVFARFASNPVAANARFDGISLPAFQAIADRLMAKQ
jgi:CubicO group peptidase (beta-lactamase class C family)